MSTTTCNNCGGYGRRYESRGNGCGEYLPCDLCEASYIRDAILDVCNGGDVDRAVKNASEQIMQHYAASSAPVTVPNGWKDVLQAIQDVTLNVGWKTNGMKTIHELCAYLLAAPTAPSADAQDAKRLDFLIKNPSWIQWREFDSTFKRCQLMTQNEDEEYISLSGPEDKYFATPREAIDAALSAQQKEGE